MTSLIFTFLFLGFECGVLACGVLWVCALVDLFRRPDWQFEAIGRDRGGWLILVALTGPIGLCAYGLSLRPQLKAAERAGQPVSAHPHAAGVGPQTWPHQGNTPPAGWPPPRAPLPYPVPEQRVDVERPRHAPGAGPYYPEYDSGASEVQPKW